MAALFAACGDEVTQTVMGESGVAELAHGEGFPKCAKENLGEALFAEDSGKFFYCLGGKWRELDGKDGERDTLFVLDTLVGTLEEILIRVIGFRSAASRTRKVLGG